MVAVVNDTVGTMMTCAYEEPTCEVGLIVGGCPERSLSERQGGLGFLFCGALNQKLSPLCETGSVSPVPLAPPELYP